MQDFKVEFHGSIFLVKPLTQVCHDWLKVHTQGQWWCGSLVVDAHNVDALVNTLVENGFAAGDDAKGVETEVACPECGSTNTRKRHFSGNGAVPEVNFLECQDCDAQWDHN